MHKLFEDFIQGSRLEDKRELYFESWIFDYIHPDFISDHHIFYMCERYQNVVPKQCALERHCT